MKKLICVITVALFTLGISASSGTYNKTITVQYGVTLGVTAPYAFNLVDAAGNPVQPFVYEGSIYVPIRSVANAFGATVFYEGTTNTALIYLPVAIKTSVKDITFPLHIISYDWKTYLGKCVTDEHDEDGIYYKYSGNYSSKYSDTSIWNEHNEFSQSHSDTSYCYDHAQHPPKIIDNNGKLIAYLSTNEHLGAESWTVEELKVFLINNNQ